MKNNKGFGLLVVVLAVVAVGLVVGGAWYYQASKNSIPAQLPSQPGVQQIQPSANNPTSTPAQTTPVSPVSSVSSLPISGPAGTMIILNGNFSVCGNQVPAGECTTDRFDQPVFLQSHTSMSSNISTYVRSDGNIAYQVPTSLAPGKYEFAMQNCFGKGCTNYHLGWLTVTASNIATIPTISSISPQVVSSSALAGTVITLHGSNFSARDNYISFVGDGTINGSDGSPVNYSYISDTPSPDGKTITLRLPTCSASTGPTCEWVPNGAYWTSDGGYQIAVSNTNGTSNFWSLKTQ